MNQSEICSGVKTFFILAPDLTLFHFTSPALVAITLEVRRKITFYVNIWRPNRELQLLSKIFKLLNDKSSYRNYIKHISPRSLQVKKNLISLENWNVAFCSMDAANKNDSIQSLKNGNYKNNFYSCIVAPEQWKLNAPPHSATGINTVWGCWVWNCFKSNALE